MQERADLVGKLVCWDNEQNYIMHNVRGDSRGEIVYTEKNMRVEEHSDQQCLANASGKLKIGNGVLAIRLQPKIKQLETLRQSKHCAPFRVLDIQEILRKFKFCETCQ